MITKSMSRKRNETKKRKIKKLGELLEYIANPVKNNNRTPVGLLWNFSSQDTGLINIKNEFLENRKYAKKRKNGVKFYHEVISFSPKDKEKVSREILYDITQKYLELRAEKSLAYAQAHFDADNPHVHLVISGNQVKSSTPTRITKFQYRRAKRELERYQREKYPELEYSRVEHGKKSPYKTKTSRREQEANRRLRKNKKQTEKEKLANLVFQYLKFTSSRAEFEAKMKSAGFRVYQRGKTLGIENLTTSRRHRFKTLGVLAEYEAARLRWERRSEREKEFHSLQVAKGRQYWQEFGFREEINHLLSHGQGSLKEQELNGLLRKKRRCHREPSRSLEMEIKF